MSSIQVTRFIRNVLLADGLVSAAAGAVMALGGESLSGLLQLPTALLLAAGLCLLAYAALLVWASRRDALPRGALWALFGTNLVWAVDCLTLAFGGWFAPSGLGQAFLVMQAVAVLAFAELYFISVRRVRHQHASA